MADVDWFFRKGWLAENGLSADEQPSDPAIPQLRELLDASAMKVHIQQALCLLDPAAPKRVLDQRVASVAYRPGRECRVNYSVGVAHRPGRATERCLVYAKSISLKRARNRQTGNASNDESKNKTHVLLNHGRTSLSAFPCDVRLSGLREFVKPQKFHTIANKALSETRLRMLEPAPEQTLMPIVSYRPERHCLVRVSVRSRSRGLTAEQPAYARLYRDDRGAGVFRIMKNLWCSESRNGADQHQPEPLAYDPVRRILIQGGIPGRPLAELTEMPDFLEHVGRAATALAAVHASHFDHPRLYRKLLAEEQVRWLAKSAHGLKKVYPTLGVRLQTLTDGLLASMPVSETDLSCLIHGDFSLNQVLAEKDKVGIIDFDDAGIGDPHADIGSCFARMHSSIPASGLREQAFETFGRCYRRASQRQLDEKRIRWHYSLGLSRLGLSRLSHLRAGWRTQTEHFLDLALSLRLD